jgi:hypothetical protein
MTVNMQYKQEKYFWLQIYHMLFNFHVNSSKMEQNVSSATPYLVFIRTNTRQNNVIFLSSLKSIYTCNFNVLQIFIKIQYPKLRCPIRLSWTIVTQVIFSSIVTGKKNHEGFVHWFKSKVKEWTARGESTFKRLLLMHRHWWAGEVTFLSTRKFV